MVRARVVTGIAVLAAVAIGAVGGALIGVPGLSGAQTFPSAGPSAATPAVAGPQSRPAARGVLNEGNSALLDAAAKALNLTTQQLRQKLSDGKTTIADVAKQQNIDVNTVIDAMVNADRDRISNIVNSPWPGLGPLGPTPPKFGFGILGAAFNSVSKALGISNAELKADLAKGESIADIAKSKSLDVNTVINALVADASSKIDQAVANKHLSQSEADKLEAGIKNAITALVNNGFPKGSDPLGGPHPAPFGGPSGSFGGAGRFGRFGGRGKQPTPPSTPPTTKAPTS